MKNTPIESLSLMGKRNSELRFTLVQPDEDQICPITQV